MGAFLAAHLWPDCKMVISAIVPPSNQRHCLGISNLSDLITKDL